MTRSSDVKVLLAAVVVGLGGAGLTLADDAAKSAGPSPILLQRGTTTEARAALSTQVPDLYVDGMALSKVIDYLRDATNCNLVVNWKVLEAANVTKDTTITLNVRDLSLRKLMRLVLEQASPTVPLTWTVDSNVITVTSAEEADKIMVTRVYVVDDLIMSDNDPGPPPVINLQTVTQNGVTQGGQAGGGQGALGGGGGGFFGNATSNTTPQPTAKERGEELVKMIEAVVRPDIWRDNGGTCSIRFFSGKLIVTAPESVQQMIGGVSGG